MKLTSIFLAVFIVVLLGALIVGLEEDISSARAEIISLRAENSRLSRMLDCSNNSTDMHDAGRAIRGD